MRGVVVGVGDTSDYDGRLQEVEADGGLVLLPETLVWWTRVAEETGFSLGFILGKVLPAPVRSRRRRWALNVSWEEAQEQLSTLARRAPAQVRVLEALADGPLTHEELCRRADVRADTLGRLARKQLVRPEVLPFSFAFKEQRPHFRLTKEQEQAVEQVIGDVGTGGRRLLVGPPGAGKTEVYLRALAAVVEQGGTGALLAPEISLLPQLSARVQALTGNSPDHYFGELPPGERWRVWQRALAGDLREVVGTRSAVFLPLRAPGLLVLDEEGEGQYKQEGMAPHYHAVRVAEIRALHEGTGVLFGAAAPSVELYYRAQRGELGFVRLTQRVVGTRPEVHVVSDKGVVVGPELEDAVRRHLSEGGQVLLLVGRRGYFTGASCRACGVPLRCTDCALALVFHLSDRTFRCPGCGDTVGSLTCRACGGSRFRLFGVGTQRVEQEVRRLFPSATLARLDTDAAGERSEVLSAMAAGSLQILVGAQMIGKGLDFPGITLVGVVNADALLSIPDFRAGERAYRLVAGAIGRAGRGEKPGEVIVQTEQPDHYSVRYAVAEDYEGFYNEELEYRRMLNYPPFSRLAKLIVEGRDCVRRAQELAGQLGAFGIEVLGPARALPRRGVPREQLLIRGEEDLPQRLEAALPQLPRDVRLDIDPAGLG